MIKVYIDGLTTYEPFETINPILAEAVYFRYCKLRVFEKAFVIIEDPQKGVEPARYALKHVLQDKGPREQNKARYAQVWALPGERKVSPTPAQIQGASKAASLNGVQAAKLLGVDPRTWRYWISEDKPRSVIPKTTWFTLLTLTGLDIRRFDI